MPDMSMLKPEEPLPEEEDTARTVTVTEEDVLVLREDLRQIEQILQTVFNFLEANDMARAYQQLHDSIRPSPLTREVGRRLDKVQNLVESPHG